MVYTYNVMNEILEIRCELPVDEYLNIQIVNRNLTIVTGKRRFNHKIYPIVVNKHASVCHLHPYFVASVSCVILFGDLTYYP